MKFRNLLVSAAWVCLVGNAAQAATIVWDSPTQTTGLASDVLTVGTLVEASCNNPASPTVNGVPFTAQGSGISYIGYYNLNFTSYANTPSTWASPDPGMVALVGGSAYSVNAITLTLNNLVIGGNYIVQIFEPTWDHNWMTNFTGGANTSDYVSPSGAAGTGPANLTPEYIVGSFTADGSSQTIGTSGPNGYTEVAAVQVRAVPEPATWAIFLAGFGVLGFKRMRRP